MAQISVPTSLTSTDWTGVVASLGDASDATYIESPADPIATSTFLCAMGALSDPGVDTGHQIRVRAAVNGVADLTLALENTDDGSVVATVATDTDDIGSSFADVVLTLTAAQAALIHSYSGLRIRGYARKYTATYFVWEATAGADSYLLQVGTTSGGSDTFNEDVGAVLTSAVNLLPGTYYARVYPVTGGVEGTPSAEQEVTV